MLEFIPLTVNTILLQPSQKACQSRLSTRRCTWTLWPSRSSSSPSPPTSYGSGEGVMGGREKGGREKGGREEGRKRKREGEREREGGREGGIRGRKRGERKGGRRRRRQVRKKLGCYFLSWAKLYFYGMRGMHQIYNAGFYNSNTSISPPPSPP